MYLMDFGLGMLLVILAVLMGWRLFDLFKNKGRWAKEVDRELSEEVTK
jgi:heme A synthase